MSRHRQRHIAFFLFPDYGHLAPTLDVGRLLVGWGHRVSYVVDDSFSGPVSGVGGHHVAYRSGRRAFHSGDFDDTGEVGVRFLRTCIEEVLPLSRTRFGAAPPDLLVYDYENFAVARALAAEWGVPTAQFSPYFASNDTFSLRGELMGGNTDHQLVQETIGLLQAFLGAQGMDPGMIWSLMREYDDRNLVAVCRDLQPHGASFDDKYVFVGPCVPEAVPSWPRPGTDPVVLVSMGTESNGRTELMRTLVADLVGSGWRVLLTAGATPDWAAGVPAVEVYEWLPLPAVSRAVDAVVCAGGMGTVMQVLSAGTPMVVVPHLAEQWINARRLAELGLGAVLDPAGLGGGAASAAVARVVSDSGTRDRLASMRASIAASGGSSRAATAIVDWS